MKKRISVAAVAVLLLCTLIWRVYAENIISESTDEIDNTAINEENITEVADWIYKQEQYNTKMSDAYARRNASEESVNTQTGVLTLSQVDYSIPLTEGEFELRRIFNSNMACADYGYNTGPNKVMEIESFITKTYRLGEGWRYSFPALELFTNGNSSYSIGANIENIMYHSESGQVYSIRPEVEYTLSGSNNIEEDPDVTYFIDNHTLKDIEFKFVYNEYPTGILDNITHRLDGFEITHRKQKVVYLFGADGKISSITYNGVDKADFGYAIDSNGIRTKLKSITVTTGGIENRIEFSYGEDGTQDANSIVEVYLPNDKSIKYVYENYEGSDEYYGHRVIEDVYDIDGELKYSFIVSKKDVNRNYRKTVNSVPVIDSRSITMNVIESIYYHKSNRISTYGYTETANTTNNWQYYNVVSHQDREIKGSEIGVATTYTYPTGNELYEDEGLYTEKFTGSSSFWKQNPYASNDSKEIGTFTMQNNCMNSWLRMHNEIFSNKQYYSDYVVEATIVMGDESITEHSSGGIIFAVSDYRRGNNNFNGYYARIKPDGDEAAEDQIALMKMTAGGDGYDQQAKTLKVASFASLGLPEKCLTETPYNLKIKMDPITGKIELYVNGILAIEYTDSEPYTHGSVGLRSFQRRMFVTHFRVAEGNYTSETKKTETSGAVSVVTTDTYDYESNLVSKSVEQDTYKTVTMYEYDSNRMPKSITVHEYENDKLKQSKTESYTYDEYGNMTEYFGPLAKERYQNGTVIDRNPGTEGEDSTETENSDESASEEDSTEVTEDSTEAVEDDTLYAECIRYTYDYEKKWFLPTAVEHLVNDEMVAKTVYVLTDDDARIKTEEVYAKDDLVKVTGYEYDSYGRITSKSVKESDSENERGYLTTYSYSALNKVKDTYTVTERTVVRADDQTTDEKDDIIKETEKDALSGVVVRETIDGVNVYYDYFDDERLRSITYGDGENAKSVSYEYKSSPLSIAFTDEEGNKTLTVYNGYGNEVSRSTDYNGTGSTVDTASYKATTKITYDRWGNIMEVIDANGNQTMYRYDAKNRLTRKKIYTYKTTDSGEKIVENSFVTEYEYGYETDANGDTLYVVTTKYMNQDQNGYIGSEKVYYDLENKEVCREDGEGNKTKYEYDYANNKVSETDGKGNITKYEYDVLNRLVKVTYANDNATAYTYNALGGVKEKTEDGHVYKNTYDSAGRLIREEVDGYYTEYTYDNRNNVISIEKGTFDSSGDKMSEHTDYTYTLRDQVDTVYVWVYDTETKTVKQETHYGYDGCGNVISESLVFEDINSLGEGATERVQLTERTFDYAGRVTSEKISMNGTIISSVKYTYDNVGNLIEKSAMVNEVQAETETEEAAEEATEAVEVELDEEVFLTETYKYDADGNITSKTAANGLVTTYEYDARGALVSESYTRTAETAQTPITKTYTYDLAGRMISGSDGEGNTTQYIYDEVGNVINKIDPRYTSDDNSIEYSYDERNRLKKTMKVENGARTELEKFTYDTRGNVIKKQQGTIVTTFTYDGLNNVLTQTDGEGGTISYTYDGSGRVIAYMDANNNALAEDENVSPDDIKSTTYTYWLNGSPKSITYPDGETVEYSIEDFDLTGSFRVTSRDRMKNDTVTEYNVWGMPEKVTYADGLSEKYTYDMLGRKISYTNREDTRVEYSYDNSGNVTSEQVCGKTFDEDGNVTGEYLAREKHYTYSNDNLLISETDGEGNVTEYVYDKVGNVEEIKYANGTSDLFEYKGGVLSGKKIDGVVTFYTYDVAGRLVTESISTNVFGVDDRVTAYVYDPAGNVTAKLVADGITEYDYDGAGRLVREEALRTEDESDITEYEYDKNGNVKTKTIHTEPECKTTYTYDVMGNLLTETTDGIVTTYEYDKLGRAIKQIYNSEDSNRAATTCYYYDEMGNRYAQRDANGNYTLYTYDKLGRMTSAADGVSDSAIAGAITVENYKNGNSFKTVTEYEYDCLGNHISETDGNGNTTTYEYDKAGRLTKVINAEGVIICERVYDGKGNMIKEADANGHDKDGNILYSTNYEYTNNRLVKITDKMGAVEEYVYNDFGEVTELKSPGYTEGTTLSTKYTYDNAGRITLVTMADGSKISYTYDNAGNILTQTDGNGNVTRYEYYPFGNVKSKTDAEGNQESYEYDVFGNMIKKTDGNGIVVEYTYDAQNNLTGVTDGGNIDIAYGYDNMNNRTYMSDETGNYDYSYNPRGQVTLIRYVGDSYISYTYDNAGNVTNYSNVLLGESVDYTYDELNRMETAGNETYEYDDNGNIIRMGSEDGISLEYEYDRNGSVTKLINQPLNLFSVTDVSYPTFTYEYEYYYNGYEKSKTDFNGKVEYTYDSVGRLKTVNDNSTGATRTYTYDKAGNRTKLEETFADGNSGNTTFMGGEIDYISRITEYKYSVVNTLKTAEDSYTTNTNGVATRITTYEYDKAGNEISHRASYATSGDAAFGLIEGKDGGVIDGSVEYTVNEYDALNRLVYVNSVKNTNCDEATYVYNGDGLRVQSRVKGLSTNYQDVTKYYHYNGQRLMQIAVGGFTYKETLYSAGAMGYTSVTENGETLVFVKNAHGDVNATVGSDGIVDDLYAYDEFGNVDYIRQSTDNRILYASQYLDTETGNYYLKARYYNPNIGRFTQRDPHWTPANMIYGDISESAPEPDIRSSDYAVYVPKPIQRKATVLPTGNQQKDDSVRGIIAETMAFSDGVVYNGNVYEDLFAGFGVPNEGSLFASYDARQADTGAILQSTNLYVYCTNNPVMYVDPWGLDITIIGTSEEVSEIKKNLQMLTNDELKITRKKDENGNLLDEYVVSIKEKKNGDLKSGTKLVRRIIDADENVNIAIGTGGNVYYPGVRLVLFDPNSDPDIQTVDPETGNVSEAKRPAFVGLAHELIHADREIRGVTKSGNANYTYQIGRKPWSWWIFSGYDYIYATQNVPKEELATVGLAYNSLWGDITENDIRAEHGLPLRGAY